MPTTPNRTKPKQRKPRTVRKMPTIIMTVVTPDENEGGDPHWIDPPEDLRGEYQDLAAARSRLLELGKPGIEYVILALKERIKFREETKLVPV